MESKTPVQHISLVVSKETLDRNGHNPSTLPSSCWQIAQLQKSFLKLENLPKTLVTRALILVARMLLVAPGITTRNKNATSNKGHRY